MEEEQVDCDLQCHSHFPCCYIGSHFFLSHFGESLWTQTIFYFSLNSPQCHFNTSHPVTIPTRQTRSFQPQWSFEQINISRRSNTSSGAGIVKWLIKTRLEGLAAISLLQITSSGTVLKENVYFRSSVKTISVVELYICCRSKSDFRKWVLLWVINHHCYLPL